MGVPKLKSVGLIKARAAKGFPTRTASDYDVAWVTGLTFKNSVAIAAVCITPHAKNPKTAGLHLSVDAARALIVELADAAKSGGTVAVTNHSGGDEQVWQSFSDVDAVVLAARLEFAAKGF